MPVHGRLSGIRIDVAPPPAAEVLPRMDIAVFVGFAAQGPTHWPVAVESVRQFEAVFGPDAPLAWDAGRGERAYANLAVAVRLFFSNGGRRAWVIRVARTRPLEALWRRLPEAAVSTADLAEANRFPVPGMLRVGADGAIGPAHAQARSLGSWSDGLRLRAALQEVRFPLQVEPSSSPPSERVRFTTRARLQSGDLIEFGAGTAGGSEPVRQFARIEAVMPGIGGQPSLVDARLCAGFVAIDADVSPGGGFAGEVQIEGVLATALPAQLSYASGPGEEVALAFDAPSVDGIAAGMWARFSGASQLVWVQIDAVEMLAAATSPPQVHVWLTGRGWRETAPVLPPAPPTWAALLTADLAVAAPAYDGEVRLNGVGLTPAHPAGWWLWPSDEARVASAEGSDPLASDEVRARCKAAEAAHRPFFRSPPRIAGILTDDPRRDRCRDGRAASRFPLAATDDEVRDGAPIAWVPLAVPPLFGPALGAFPVAATALERDGLSRFDPELFLDPGLADLGVDALIEHADVIRYLSDAPRRLFGMHAALSIGAASGLHHEASLIALPDAVHVGWQRRPSADVPTVPTIPGRPPAHWFTHRGPCAATPADATASSPDFGRFLDCHTLALPAPVLDGPTAAVAHGLLRLAWSSSAADAHYVLSESRTPDFDFSHDLYRGTALEFVLSVEEDGIFYYRVQAVAGDEQSLPSNTVAIVVRGDEWELLTPADFAVAGEPHLVNVQRAVLRMAAASGELFAVLSLSQHYRADDAVSYAARLRAPRASQSLGGDPRAFGFNERRALSYGALYHPWVISGSIAGRFVDGTEGRPAIRRAIPLSPDADQRRLSPPEGAILGVMAARASARGAWIAPANEPLVDIVASSPVLGAETWLLLEDARVNTVRDDPRGFLCLSADTLADDLEWQPINVRRLVTLLRRLALLRGAQYVFEPNGDVLRRAVERSFETLLTDLLGRGAFAGTTASESFRVVTSASAADRDAGRLLVELRVAPALPLQFLTLRLMQSGERLTVVEEA